MLLIKNGKILTMTGELTDGGDILIDEGKIRETGVGLKVANSRNLQTIDATECFVMPGFIDAHSHIGLMSYEQKPLSIHPTERSALHINYYDNAFNAARKSGITSAMVGPFAGNLVGGYYAFVKTGGGINNSLISDTAAMQITILTDAQGDNDELTTDNGILIASTLLDELEAAKSYIDREEAVSKSDTLEAWRPVLTGKTPLLAEVQSEEDIRIALRMSKRYGIKPTLVGCGEGYKLIDSIKESGLNIILTSHESVMGNAVENLRAIADSGITFAISSGYPNSPVELLPLLAGLAAKAGVELEKAFLAVTKNAAEIINAQDRIGTIEPGKDADVVIFDGNPLEVMSKVMYTIIDGEVFEA